MKINNKFNFKNLLLVAAMTWLGVAASHAGTVTVSATGVSNSPIFVTSTLASLSVGTQLYIGNFLDSAALATRIATYKTGVEGIGNSLAEAQTAANTAAATLYSSTFNWLSSSANFKSLPAAANSISQAGAAGRFLFASSATRSVNGVSGTYAGATGTMDVTYASFGTNSQLWAWYATGSEIGIFTDSTWTIPGSPSAPMTIGSAALGNFASEILLGTYTDYLYAPTGVGIDLISSAAISKTLTVIPEPSSASLLVLGVAGLVALRARRKS
jgi:hypothetical protein